MGRKPTSRQADILRFISVYFTKNNTSPTLQEIAQHYDMSPAGAWYHVKALEAKGLLKINHKAARGIFLSEWEEYVPGISIIPLFSEERYINQGVRKAKEEFNASALNLSRDSEYFAMRMESDSLRNIAIRPGDILVFRRDDRPNEGDVILGSLEGSDTVVLRSFHRRNSRMIILQAECDNIGNITCQSCVVHAILHAVVRLL